MQTKYRHPWRVKTKEEYYDSVYWCLDECEGDFYVRCGYYDHVNYMHNDDILWFFENIDDAILFKLTWS